MSRHNRNYRTRTARLLPILLVLMLLFLPAAICDDETPTPEPDDDDIIRVVDDDDQQQGDDDDLQGDDDQLPLLPQIPEPIILLDGNNDPICCNLCDPLTGMPLAPYYDLSQITFTYAISNGSCFGEFLLDFGQAQQLDMPFMGQLTFYDPAGPLAADDPFCWGRYGNSSYGFVFDGSQVIPNYSVVDPLTMQWGAGVAPGYEGLLDTNAITLRIPCDQINQGFTWMAHTAPPEAFPCDGMGQGADLFPEFDLPPFQY